MFNYGIGGNERKSDNAASEGIADIPQNRTLYVGKLTSDPSFRPDITHDLRTAQDVFNHFSPEQEVEFQNADGISISEKLQFRGLQDFGKNGIIKQSQFLQELSNESTDFQQVVKQLKANKILRAALENPESRAAFLATLESLMSELDAVS